jgi:hypothetical protein
MKVTFMYNTRFLSSTVFKNILDFKYKEGEAVPVHTMKACRWGRGITPFIHNLGNRWK